MQINRLLLLAIVISTSFLSHSQGWRNYFDQLENHKVEYSITEYTDTIWQFRDSISTRTRSKTYTFPVKNTCDETLLFGQSSRIGGADPDFNSGYPRTLAPEEEGEIAIWFPGRSFEPPFVLTRRYVVNSTSFKRDTLTINRVHLWADRDTIHKNYRLGNLDFSIVQHLSLFQDPILFLNLHEDEQTSIEALKLFSQEKPISYMYIEHSGERRMEFQMKRDSFSIDPNRIFTKKGRQNTLEDGGNSNPESEKSIERFATRFLWKIKKRKTVVALHNNTPDEYSIHSYLPDSSEAQNTAEIYINTEMDPDDFIYTTDQDMFHKLADLEINVVLQDNINFVDDGSLSIYCGKEGIRYVNIETERGHLEEQVHFLRIVHQLLLE